MARLARGSTCAVFTLPAGSFGWFGTGTDPRLAFSPAADHFLMVPKQSANTQMHVRSRNLSKLPPSAVLSDTNSYNCVRWRAAQPGCRR